MIIELRQKSQITIPSEYVKLLSLSAGDKLEIMVKDGALMLVPVTVYPKDYVKKLETELSKLKSKSRTVREDHIIISMICSQV